MASGMFVAHNQNPSLAFILTSLSFVATILSVTSPDAPNISATPLAIDAACLTSSFAPTCEEKPFIVSTYSIMGPDNSFKALTPSLDFLT